MCITFTNNMPSNAPAPNLEQGWWRGEIIVLNIVVHQLLALFLFAISCGPCAHRA